MRVVIFCPSGQSRTLQMPEYTTIYEVKENLEQLEGVPIEQQSIMFAGKQLQEDISLQDYALDQYTLADEVVLYMYKLLLEPKLIYLCGGQDKSHLKSDTIEYASPMSDVMALLESRQLAAGFSASSSVLAKRRDGSTIPVALSPSVTLQQLEDIVAEQEQLRPNTLCFYQAPDGSLHVSVTPSNDQASSADCYPVYARAVQPQPLMHTKPKGSSMRPLTKDVVHELCVLP